MTNRNWTPMIRQAASYNRDRMRISMNTQGMLLINQIAFHALRSPAAVTAFYEETAGLIGIASVAPDTPNALWVRKRTPGNQRAISLIHFLSLFGLQKPQKGIVFPNPTFDPDGTLVLNYRQAVANSAAGWGDSELQSEQPERKLPSSPVTIAGSNDEWSNLRA